ncbi:hypothetical protein LINPERPRIM_LOCUS3793 [Linum perenne]
MRVLGGVVQRLWGYEGPVVISKLSGNFFLMEFNSVKLCDWVLERSWHIHNTGMILRRWEKGIQPIDFSPKATPEWIEFQGVPPELITVKAVSWIASKVGKPLNKFVRDGTNVKVCVLRDRAIPCPEMVKVNNKGERVAITVLQHKPREYKSFGTKNVWRRVQADTEKAGINQSIAAPEIVPKLADVVTHVSTELDHDLNALIRVEDHGTPKGLQILVENDKIQSPSAAKSSDAIDGPGTSKANKKKKKKAKKQGAVGCSEVVLTQSTSLPDKIVHSGNVAAPSLEGTASPVNEDLVQVTGGGIGNALETSLQVESAPIQHAKSMSPVEEPKDGNLTDVTDEEENHPVSSGRKATFGDFLPFGKHGGVKSKYAASGVKTRFKTKHR